ncbi:hypothetical protein [Streptomyces eurythermus]
MVAILRCTPNEAKFLDSRKRQEQLDAGWESVGERDEWKSRHVVLVVTGQERGRPRVEYVGQARSGRSAGTFRRVVEVTQLHRVAPPVPMQALSDQLPLKLDIHPPLHVDELC